MYVGLVFQYVANFYVPLFWMLFVTGTICDDF
jgi:hypothetical protein